jgi:hypothetical protein
MKNEEFYERLEDSLKVPGFRKNTREYWKEEDNHLQQRLKKSGKRFHRRPTHKDSFGEEYFGASVRVKKRRL